MFLKTSGRFLLLSFTCSSLPMPPPFFFLSFPPSHPFIFILIRTLAPPRLHLLPPSPACLPGLSASSQVPLRTRGAGFRGAGRGPAPPHLQCTIEARRPPSGPATAGASSRRPARGLGSGARRGLARSCSGTDARAKSSALYLGQGSRGPSLGLSLMVNAGAHGGPGRGAMETATSGELWEGPPRGRNCQSRGRGLHGGASRSDRPVLRHPLPHQRHLQGPVGAGLGVQRPVMLTLHLGRDGWVRLQEAAENPPEYPRGWPWVSASGTRPRPGNQVESHPVPGRPALPQVFQSSFTPIEAQWVGLGQAEGGSCWNPRGWVRSTPGPVSGAGSQAAAWRGAWGGPAPSPGRTPRSWSA